MSTTRWRGLCILLGGAAGLCALPSAAQVCAASGSNTNYEWIDEVQVDGVVSFTGDDNGYARPTSPAFSLVPGAHDLFLTPGYPWSTYREHWAVFIDYDRDGVFGAGEQVYGGDGWGSQVATFDVPSGVPVGETVMRVAMKYGSAPSACGTFYYGEVEDYVVHLVADDAPPPVPTTTTIGFDKATDVDLAIIGRYWRNGEERSANHFFWVGGPTSREVTHEVDVGTDIVWRAVIYVDDGDLWPSACSWVSGLTCITSAGADGEIVEFAAPDPVVPPDPPVGDQVLDFENLFGGTTYAPGPSVDIDGIVVTTTASYFYNNSAPPFSSDYFGFINAAFAFPDSVEELSFEATGTCTNCTITVNASADGVVFASFDLDYGVLSNVVLAPPAGTTTVSFDRGFRMDNMAVDYGP